MSEIKRVKLHSA